MLNETIDEKELKALMQNMDRMGVDMIPPLTKAIEDGTQLVTNHAKAGHQFMGVKRKSKAEEEASVIVHVNPDGTPRFRIRTANLLNSIQAIDAKVKRESIEGQITAGMEYAADVEFGGPGRRAFPFFTPSLEANKEKIVQHMIKLLKEKLKSYGGKHI